MAQDRGLAIKNRRNKKKAVKGKNYLFVIGIDAYTEIPALENAVNDAYDFQNTLHANYQFDEEHTFSLFNEEATEKAIKDTFRKLAMTVKPEDNLIIFYSGHGMFDKVLDQGYWLPVNAGTDSMSNYISNSDLVTYLRAIKSFHTVLISDSCFSGTLFARSRHYSDRVESIPSRWALASGRDEPVSDGGQSGNSPFTSNLNYFLKNNQDATLPISRLVQFVKEAVANNSRQTPLGSPLQDVGDKGGEFVFRKKGVEVDEGILKDKLKVLEPKPQSPATLEPEPKSKAPLFAVIGAAAIALILLALWGMGIFSPEPQYPIASLENGKWGYQNNDGQWVIDPAYDAVEPFAEIDIAGNKVTGARVGIDSFYWLINVKGACITDCDNINRLHEARRLAKLPQAAQKADKWGYQNINGQWVVEPIYDSVKPFQLRKDHRGEISWAEVSLKGITWQIDSKGKCLNNCEGAEEALAPEPTLTLVTNPPYCEQITMRNKTMRACTFNFYRTEAMEKVDARSGLRDPNVEAAPGARMLGFYPGGTPAAGRFQAQYWTSNTTFVLYLEGKDSYVAYRDKKFYAAGVTSEAKAALFRLFKDKDGDYRLTMDHASKQPTEFVYVGTDYMLTYGVPPHEGRCKFLIHRS